MKNLIVGTLGALLTLAVGCGDPLIGVSPVAEHTSSNEQVGETSAALDNAGASWRSGAFARLVDGQLIQNHTYGYINTCTGEITPPESSDGGDSPFQLRVNNASSTNFDIQLEVIVDLGPGLEIGTILDSTSCEYSSGSIYRCDTKTSMLTTADLGEAATDALITQVVRESGFVTGSDSLSRYVRNRFDCDGSECDEAFAIIETNPGPDAGYPCRWVDVSSYDVAP